MYRPTTRNEWCLCGTLFIQAVAVIALEVYILIEWQSWVTPTITQVQVSYIVPIGLAILSFACVYELILLLDAIHHKNNILLLAICISNLCSVAYSGFQYESMRTATARLFKERFGYPTLVDTTRNVWPRIQPAELAVPILIALSSLILWPVSYNLHRDYSWTIYKCVNGNMKTRMRYLLYEIFLVLIKLDFYFFCAFIIHYDLVDVHFEEPEYSLTLSLMPAVLIVMFLGIYSVRREWLVSMIFVIVCFIALVAYLISRIVILYGPTLRGNTAGKGTMLLFAFMSLVFTVAVVVVSIICTMNFNHGLKAVNEHKIQAARDSYMALSERGRSPVPVHNSDSETRGSRYFLD